MDEQDNTDNINSVQQTQVEQLPLINKIGNVFYRVTQFPFRAGKQSNLTKRYIFTIFLMLLILMFVLFKMVNSFPASPAITLIVYVIAFIVYSFGLAWGKHLEEGTIGMGSLKRNEYSLGFLYRTHIIHIIQEVSNTDSYYSNSDRLKSLKSLFQDIREVRGDDVYIQSALTTAEKTINKKIAPLSLDAF